MYVRCTNRYPSCYYEMRNSNLKQSSAYPYKKREPKVQCNYKVFQQCKVFLSYCQQLTQITELCCYLVWDNMSSHEISDSFTTCGCFNNMCVMRLYSFAVLQTLFDQIINDWPF